MRSAMPAMPAMMLPWEIMTPLGMPVEPLVYMMTAMSEDSGCVRRSATADTRDTGGLVTSWTEAEHAPVETLLDEAFSGHKNGDEITADRLASSTKHVLFQQVRSSM